MIQELGVDTVKPLPKMPKPVPRTSKFGPLADGIVQVNRKGQRSWITSSDDAIVSYALDVIRKKGIDSRSALQEDDPGLYQTLRKRGLLDRTNLPKRKKYGKWSRYSDEKLIEYAQKFVDERKIRNVRGLFESNGSLYGILYRRNLLGKVNFPKKRKSWKDFSNKKLLAHAGKFIRENGIKKTSELNKANKSLYQVLIRRKLIDRIEFRD